MSIASSLALKWNVRGVEFADQPRSGQTTFGLVVGLYSTNRPPLPDREGE
jgi:hypothetical protein